MRILLLGRNGQVGWELQRSLLPLGELIALSRCPEQGLCGDLAHPASIIKTIRTLKPTVIVNAAAYTAVDKAESEYHKAYACNAEAVDVMAKEAARLGALFVHYSTDYVFNGRGEKAWQESDAPEPLNVYGQTKWDGEQFILESGCAHLIFRTSWVYATRGQNFIKTMLRLAQVQEEIRVVGDQIGVPTGADLIADITAHAIHATLKNNNLEGLYHLVPQGQISWHHYARKVITQAERLGYPVSTKKITPIFTIDYPTPAIRPLNSRLNTDKLTQAFGLHLPHWEIGVDRMIAETVG